VFYCQAEDGIRDFHVTGVQTCALPILNNYAYYLSIEGIELAKAETMISKVIELEPLNPTYLDTYAWILFKRENYLEALYFIEQRSEERRVGKECRYRCV